MAIQMHNILTFDLETQTQTAYKRKAQKFHPDNYIVASGFKYGEEDCSGEYFTSKKDSITRFKFPDLTNVKLLVGMNIKFDLLWSWERQELQEWLKAGGKIWDIQYAEYLIQGQQKWAHMLSMNDMVEGYGGTLKMDAVKAMWDADIETSDIPQDILMKYLLGCPEEELEGDVNNTYLIFKGQCNKIVNGNFPTNFITMVQNRMEGLLATTEMENNGLFCNLELGMQMREELAQELVDYEEKLNKYLPKLPEEFTFNWSSNYHKSYLFYGGTAKYGKWVQHRDEESDEPLYAKKKVSWPLYNGIPIDPKNAHLQDGEPDTFKGGKRAGELKTKQIIMPDFDKPKGAIQDHFLEFKGYTTPDKRWISSQTDAVGVPLHSTSADIIKELAVLKSVPFVKDVAKRQKLAKDLGTYYWEEDKKGKRKGMLTLVNSIDSCIHHQLNHVQTVTSRMSSSNPNLQNIPRKDSSDIKQVFESRFGGAGVICEIDYSSLEVVVQAVLTGDKQLIKDLNDGIDFHCKRLSAKLHMDYTVCKAYIAENKVYEIVQDGDDSIEITYGDLRTRIKSFTFARAYGAGAVSIAYDTGMDVDEVKALIELEDNMYSGVVDFDNNLEAAIQKSRVPTTQEAYVAKQRFILGIGHWFSPTGTKFVWQEHETPEFMHKQGKFVGFKPTERKNYPVQGVGGEIVQTMLGLVWRWLVSKNHFDGKALLVNTVHDSVYLDLHKSVVNQVVPTVKIILESVPEKYKKDFNMTIPVPFPTEVEIGSSMWHTKHYNKEEYT